MADDERREKKGPHEKLFGKPAEEVEYGELCPICNSRIDEYGYCACGGSAD